ncbi:hypothetical protein BaRGS_00038450 [Batillaria attramentaria]|uniref:Uncharacterized protein n=1 Tax=Batillaria attramentaria TaxID=370345 RepID=A0ABD0J615_9CAEN
MMSRPFFVFKKLIYLNRNMYHLVLLVIACAASAVAQHPTVDELLHGDVITDYSPYDKAWADFKTKFDRQYGSSDEEDYRKQLFMDNIKKFEAHNKDYINGKTTYVMDINQFTDMTFEEFARYVHLQPAKPTPSRTKRQLFGFCRKYRLPPGEPPASWDWRDKGYVSHVKAQGHCGACWAFATQLVDCHAKHCRGGNVEEAYKYIKNTGGIMSDRDYPYTSGSTKQAGTCKFDRSKVVAGVTGCQYTEPHDETAMKYAVYYNGPLAVSIVLTDAFRHHSSGVFKDDRCKNGALDHCLLIVGYGTSNGDAYWIAKNSWGLDKGRRGYWLLFRGANTCRVAEDVSFPLVTSQASPRSAEGTGSGPRSAGGTGGTGGSGAKGATRSLAIGPRGKPLLVICHGVFAFLITSVITLY